jgi:hypothetical protein
MSLVRPFEPSHFPLYNANPWVIISIRVKQTPIK